MVSKWAKHKANKGYYNVYITAKFDSKLANIILLVLYQTSLAR